MQTCCSRSWLWKVKYLQFLNFLMQICWAKVVRNNYHQHQQQKYYNNTHSCPYAASSCFLVYMGTSVFLSMSSDLIDLVQNISPHLSTLLIFLFLFLSWINPLVWFVTWTHKLMSQHNWGWHAVTWWQKWTPGGEVQVEEGTDLSMTPKISIAVCFASWKHGLGLSQSI